MKTYTPEALSAVLAEHSKWLENPETGTRADLTRANLAGADLTRANLTGANLARAYLTRANLARANLTRASLTDANLTGANLTRANLARAYLTRANLARANLTGANLTGANLTRAYLTRASLARANLTGANLTDANLTGANLARAYPTGANLPAFAIVPEEGAFTAFKKTREGAVLTLEIPADAKRTNSTGRKCRASKARVIASSMPGNVFTSTHDRAFLYRVGETVDAPDYNPDIRLECAGGIHFFITRKEAETYDT
jgi:hypothetical protein